VLHFDLSPAKRNSAEDLRSKLNAILDEQDAKMQVKTVGTPGDRLESLIKQTYEKSGNRVVLLVDEYDAPVMYVLHNAEILPEIREVMRELFESLKACNTYLKFVFITGVSTFSQMGIFSELNNLDVITNDNEYASLCGITQQELLDNFREGVHELSVALGCSEEDTLVRLKYKYDGYHFTKSLLGIYNPFSLMKAFKSKNLGDYWFDTGTSTSLLNAFKRYTGDFQIDLEEIDSRRQMCESDFVRSLEDHARIIPLLYQTGYLTIKEYDALNDLYVLGVPNAEVRVGLFKNLLSHYLLVNDSNFSAPTKLASTALLQGDINRAMEILRSLLKSLPYGTNETKIYHDLKTTEQYFHNLFHIFFNMLCDLVTSEVRNSTGATDVVITTPKYVYVVEIKINSTTRTALKQIDEKGYAVPYMTGLRAVYKVGVNFSTKQKTLSDWKVVEAKGVTENPH
jgi:hypothetical protein